MYITSPRVEGVATGRPLRLSVYEFECDMTCLDHHDVKHGFLTTSTSSISDQTRFTIKRHRYPSDVSHPVFSIPVVPFLG